MISKPGTYRTELFDQSNDPSNLAHVVGETPFGDWAGVIGYQLPESWNDDGRPVRFSEHRITGEYQSDLEGRVAKVREAVDRARANVGEY